MRKINQTIPQIKKSCRKCKTVFFARYSHQNMCRKCKNESYQNKSKVLKEKRKKRLNTTKKKIEDISEKIEGSIVGIESFADYLNIGEPDLRNKLENEWIDLPKEKITLVKPNKKNGLRHGTPTFVFNKKKVDEYFNNTEKTDPRKLTLALNGYKEPLTKVEGGFGYYGVVLQTENNEYIQCHICGKLFKHLAGHIWFGHKLKVNDFKDRFGISHTTALTSETTRWKLKNRTLEWLKQMDPEEKQAYIEKRREALIKGRNKRTTYQPKKTLEGYNKDGTCPDQLLQKIKDVANELEHTPSLKEFVLACKTQRYKHLIFKVYGSWNKAIEMANLKKRASKIGRGKRIFYDTEELLEYLHIFAEENNEIPTHTDFKTSLLPDESIYTRRFGSIEKARQLAGVYDVVSTDKVNEFKNKPKNLTNSYQFPRINIAS